MEKKLGKWKVKKYCNKEKQLLSRQKRKEGLKRQKTTKTHLSWRHVGAQRDRLGIVGKQRKKEKQRLEFEGKKRKRKPSEPIYQQWKKDPAMEALRKFCKLWKCRKKQQIVKGNLLGNSAQESVQPIELSSQISIAQHIRPGLAEALLIG